jgi:hypothetical protein
MLVLRCKGLKTREEVDLATVYQRAVKERVASQKAAKKAARKSR